MAETYREIQATEVDSGSPLTAELAEAWRANVLAIGEGASGAPRIVADAMSGSVAGTNNLFGLAGNTYTTDGDNLQVYDATFKATTDSEVRVSFAYRAVGGGGGNVSVQVRKNGTAVLTETKNGVTNTTHTVDITLTRGDSVTIFLSRSAGTGDECSISAINYKVGSQLSVGGI